MRLLQGVRLATQRLTCTHEPIVYIAALLRMKMLHICAQVQGWHSIIRHTKRKLLRTLPFFLAAAPFLAAPSSAFPRPFFALFFAS